MTQVTIVKGPSKFDLMLALFDNMCSHPRYVMFTVENGHTVSEIVVAIDSVEREDGSGESWNFTGYAQSTGINKGVSGYYSTQHRSGTMQHK